MGIRIFLKGKLLSMSNIYELGIIGLGPAGIGAAMGLRKHFNLRDVVCFERGRNDDRILCRALTDTGCCLSKKCDIISGVGGASTLSSGKLSDYPAGSGLLDFFGSEKELRELFDEAITLFSENVELKKVDISDSVIQDAKAFYQMRGVEYKYYDVYEFDGAMYRKFIQETVTQMQREGLCIVDNAEVYSIQRNDNKDVYQIKIKRGENEEEYVVRKLILATGGLDLQDQLFSQLIETVKNDIEIGLRVEVPCETFAEMLSSHGDLKLKLRTGRTYCVTVDGRIIAYQTGGFRFLEGCVDQSGSSGYTNLAILIKCHDVDLSAFLKNYQTISAGVPVKQRFVDYERVRKSEQVSDVTLEGCALADINRLLPTVVNNEIKGFINCVLVEAMGIPAESITVVAPELKILRKLSIKNNFEIVKNVYVIGAATGKFRGILQSFVSGVKCGRIITRR